MSPEPTAEKRSPTSPRVETGPSAELGSAAAAAAAASPSHTSPPPSLSASAGETHSPTIQRARYHPGRFEGTTPHSSPPGRGGGRSHTTSRQGGRCAQRPRQGLLAAQFTAQVASLQEAPLDTTPCCYLAKSSQIKLSIAFLKSICPKINTNTAGIRIFYF